MKVNRLVRYLVTFAFGVATGILSYQYISNYVLRESAEANLMAAGDSLRKNDLTAAMMYAQSAAAQAPYAYSPYEAAGDIYVRFGLTSAAREMYEKAIQKLTRESQGAMLVTKGAVSPDNAIALIRHKLNSLPPTGSTRAANAQ